MKKLLSVLILGALVLSMVACGGDSEKPAAETTEATKAA